MPLTLTPETETRLRTLAEAFGVDPAEYYEDLMQQALAETEAHPNEMRARLAPTNSPQGNLNPSAE